MSEDFDLQAFITGSHAHGTPTASSDIDLAVVVSKEHYDLLWRLSDSRNKLVFGKLNLIAFILDNEEDRRRYHVWRQTNNELVARKPVTHEQACHCYGKSGADDGSYGEDD